MANAGRNRRQSRSERLYDLSDGLDDTETVDNKPEETDHNQAAESEPATEELKRRYSRRSGFKE